MAQTNKQVNDRFKFTGTTGGKQQRYGQLILADLIEAGKKVEVLVPDGTDKTNFMNAFDTACTAAHTAMTNSITN